MLPSFYYKPLTSFIKLLNYFFLCIHCVRFNKVVKTCFPINSTPNYVTWNMKMSRGSSKYVTVKNLIILLKALPFPIDVQFIYYIEIFTNIVS